MTYYNELLFLSYLYEIQDFAIFTFLGRGGNEQRFMGDGQTFKGKLIGVLEVQVIRFLQSEGRPCQKKLWVSHFLYF